MKKYMTLVLGYEGRDLDFARNVAEALKDVEKKYGTSVGCIAAREGNLIDMPQQYSARESGQGLSPICICKRKPESEPIAFLDTDLLCKDE